MKIKVNLLLMLRIGLLLLCLTIIQCAFSQNVDSLKVAIQNKKINIEYILDLFGQPNIKKTDKGLDYLEFHKYNFNVTTINNIAVKLEKYNYKGIKKHSLGISYIINNLGEFYSGFTIYIHNFSNKNINYIWISATGVNGVGDKRKSKILQATGPVKPNEYGIFEFDRSFDSQDIVNFKITNLKIQYQDKATRIYSEKDIKELMLYEGY